MYGCRSSLRSLQDDESQSRGDGDEEEAAGDLVAEPDAAAQPGTGVDTAVMAPVEVRGVSISPNRPTRVFIRGRRKRCCQAASEGLCCLFSLKPLRSTAL